MHNPDIVALVVLRMKKTDLVKNLEKKIKGKMQASGVPGRFAEGAAQLPDRREQRKLNQAAGLVPFAVKLPGELAKQLQALAEAGDGNLNALVAGLLRAGLVAGPEAAAALARAPEAPALKTLAPKAFADKVPAKDAAAETAAAKKVPVKQAPAKQAATKKAAR
jgi:hypothetical protein